MTTATRIHDDLVAATWEQRRRLSGPADRWGESATSFRQDPRREMEPNLQVIASYVGAGDVLIDVGGGAGRYGLPLALHCREVINVEPSPAMAKEFDASALEAGIKNVRQVRADWLAAGDVQGDVSLVSNVTYFVNDIAAFVEKLNAACRKRAIIVVSSSPPPNRSREVFRVVHGEELTLVPGHREVTNVLWEMGFLPDVRVLGSATLPAQVFKTREEAIDTSLRTNQCEPKDPEASRRRLQERFDDLFVSTPDGFTRAVTEDARLMVITWETRS